jgi:hypothetical protein
LTGAVNDTVAVVAVKVAADTLVGAPGGEPLGPLRVDSEVEAFKPIPIPLRTGTPKLI